MLNYKFIFSKRINSLPKLLTLKKWVNKLIGLRVKDTCLEDWVIFLAKYALKRVNSEIICLCFLIGSLDPPVI